MKTRVITLRFKVPAWLPNQQYWRRVYMTYKYIARKLRPYKCHDCGVTINYKFPHFEYRPECKNRVMLQLFSQEPWTKHDKRYGVCNTCTAHRISGLFSRIPKKPMDEPEIDHTFTTFQKCDCCGETKDTIGISFDKSCDIRFGGQWWNGHHMCERCLTETAKHGTQSSSRSEWFSGGHSYYIDNGGAPVGLPHWWSLLFDKKETK